MTSTEIQAHDGGTFKAHIVMPDSTPAGAVIVVQEIFGINNDVRKKCEEMADLGFIGIAPDLFWRIEPGIELYDSNPEQLQRAFHLFGEFNVELGIKDLQSTLNFIRKHPDCNGHVGAVGYCLGGKLAYMLAAASDIDASVSYYGVGIEAMLGQADAIKNPILLHIAGNDQFVPKAAQEKIIETLKDHDTAETFHYPGMDHAFARENGMHYNAQAATLANERTATFLKAYLGEGKVAKYAR
ncbi:MAG TPA: dienelactone hydrolase family protein [Alphaproteobacteria bacterium]|nr:dienelactone hydrolase family protein [Alphaproteobacteria bacterium]